MKTATILKNARKSLVKNITDYVRMYDSFQWFGSKNLISNGDTEFDGKYFSTQPPTIGTGAITKFVVTQHGLDFDVAFFVEDAEIPSNNVGIDKLGEIATFLEKEWRKL